MARARRRRITTTTTDLTPAELREEVLQCVPYTYEYEYAFLLGDISRALMERGIDCPLQELIDCLSGLQLEGSVEMMGAQGSSLNDIDVRYRRHMMSDEGCEHAPTPPDEDFSMCHGLPGLPPDSDDRNMCHGLPG